MSARVGITTPDGAQKLTDAGAVPFTAGTPGNQTVTVDRTRTFPLSGAALRYVGIALTANSGSWWSVADVRGYVSADAADG